MKHTIEFTSKLSRLMKLSWEIQKSKRSTRSKALIAAWSLFSNEDIAVYYLVKKLGGNRSVPQKSRESILSLSSLNLTAMKYFNECKTIDEVKAHYKQLAKQYHPDHGGDTATMQALNTEYAYACAKVLKGENLTSEETEEQIRLSEEYRQVIERIINLPNIVIELVGNWIWVTGNTYPIRKQLKEAGLFFSSKKLAWYYRSEEFKTKGGKKTLNEIRKKYGSERVHSGYKENLIE